MSTTTTWSRYLLPLAVLALSAFVAVGCGGDGDDKDSTDASAKGILAYAAEDWPTVGGSGGHTFHSTLDEITTDNVKDLKGKWKVDLESGTEGKHSHEENIIAIDGNLYLETGDNDVFAYDGSTGEQLWRVDGDLDPEISTVCCGWESRGLGYDGEDTLYSGRIDGKVVAMDIETGEVKWETQVVDWKKDNATLIGAPRYYDGRVYVGNSGSEFQARGRVVALDAETGEEDWTFWTTGDGEDELADPTWEGDSALTGGSGLWQGPAVDPELGLIIFGTSTSSPDMDGTKRGGDNLYSNSIVAVDAKTGEYEWHFQIIKHDIWDGTVGTAVMLFDAEIDGETVPAAAVAPKLPWVYAVDRRNGEPIYKGSLKDVPQSEESKTAKQQWIPDTEPLFPLEISDEDFKAIESQIRQSTAIEDPKNVPIFRGEDGNAAELLFPAHDSKTAAVMLGAPSGGSVWVPLSYSPEAHMVYVCGQNSLGWGQLGENEGFVEGKVSLGGGLGSLGFNQPGYFTALDADTNEPVWSYKMEDEQGEPNSCYSGSATTAGGLVFVGKNDGHLVALDAKTGDELWSFQTGAGVNAPPTVFWADGEQKVAVVAGGNSLAGTTHGDNLWVFSLTGEVESLPG
ncbi:MAG: PQQ-binding-like beta-propeller repeat protein, partial [Rhodococcus sp.]|nr:PQQ-binding-like beta-propeller repeat protein [Rhodococcus sp. (in: high G+C Gram-positive bacteria)]